MIECVRYEEERDRLIGSVTAVIGIEEWRRRLEEEEDGEILTVLEPIQGREGEREKVISLASEFLTQAWGKRT